MMKSSGLFADVSNVFVEKMCKEMDREFHNPGHTLFTVSGARPLSEGLLTCACDSQMGERGDSMYFITRGSLGIFIDDGERVASMKEGDFVGEISVLHQVPRTATGICEGYVEVYRLKKVRIVALRICGVSKLRTHRVRSSKCCKNFRNTRLVPSVRW